MLLVRALFAPSLSFAARQSGERGGASRHAVARFLRLALCQFLSLSPQPHDRAALFFVGAAVFAPRGVADVALRDWSQFRPFSRRSL